MNKKSFSLLSKSEKKTFVPPEARKRNNVHQIFRKFDIDGSNSIEEEELSALLRTLQVPMTPAEVHALLQELDTSGDGSIGFEEFYECLFINYALSSACGGYVFYLGFVAEASNQRKKNIWGYLASLSNNILSNSFKRLAQEVEARNLILDHIIWETENISLLEFRISHPALFSCDRYHYF